MMKIGILTFHRAINYGAVLQCYALYSVMKEKGHDVEIIDYRPSFIEKYRKTVFWKGLMKEPFISRIKSLCAILITYKKKKRVIRNFDSFLNTEFKLSHVVTTEKDIPTYYDLIIFGSDQIWSPNICGGFDKIYWAQFSKRHTRFATYAASLGGHNRIDDNDWKQIKTLLGAYDYISVRESKLHNDLYEKTGYMSDIVLDPTLLAPRELFDRIAKKPVEDKYVLLFTLEENDDSIGFAKRIAKEKGCKVVKISSQANLHKQKGIIYKEGISPCEFCGYFKYATFVVTISFHGTAFSVIFNKDFYTIHSSQEDRAVNLLKSVGLESRIVYPSEVESIEPVDHESTNSKIEALRIPSTTYLERCLN